jgi:uncharacterized protein YukE
MRVDPQRVVELAGRCDEAVQRIVVQWSEVGEELRAACDRLGDCTGASSVASAYADTLTAADEVVVALAQALEGGVAALIDSARDVTEADDTVALEIGRAAGGHGLHRGWEGNSHGRGGHGG